MPYDKCICGKRQWDPPPKKTRVSPIWRNPFTAIAALLALQTVLLLAILIALLRP